MLSYMRLKGRTHQKLTESGPAWPMLAELIPQPTKSLCEHTGSCASDRLGNQISWSPMWSVEASCRPMKLCRATVSPRAKYL